MTKKTYEIPIRITVESSNGYEFSTAKFVAEVIRGKIKKSLDGDSSVVKWSIDLPNEVID